MRKVRITRKKNFSAFFSKVYLYLEDEKGTIEIATKKCRCVGILKNGEALTLSVSDEEHQLYASIGSYTPYSNVDCYTIPKGNKDIEASGSCKFSPPCFLFDQKSR